MKFYEAVMLGIPEIIFTNSTWFEKWGDGRCFGCLIGAALFSQGHDLQVPVGGYGIDLPGPAAQRIVYEFWPWLQDLPAWLPCPVCSQQAKPQYTNPGILAFATHIAMHYIEHSTTLEEIGTIFKNLEEKYGPKAVEELELAEEVYSCT